MCDDATAAIPMPTTADDASSTAQLLRRARSGDQSAIESLFGRQRQLLREWATGRLPHWARDGTDTDDLVQETLLQTWKRLDAFEPRGAGALRAYLRCAFVNRVRDELRRPPRPVAMAAVEAVLRAEERSPFDLAVDAESLARYERALDRLTPAERASLIGRLEFGLTFDELAAWVGKPSGEAARKSCHRALARLVDEMNRPLSG